MTNGEDLAEPLINEQENSSSITSSVFPVAENYIAVTRPLSGYNPVSHDPEEKDTSRWVWGEVRAQCWLAGPIMGYFMLQHIMILSGMIFVGHLGSLPLAAAALTYAFMNMSGFTLLGGMATALETLCGQAYGAKQYRLLGVYLHRAIIVITVTAVPLSIIWLNMGSILVAMGQDPVIAQAAQSFTYWLMPVVISFAMLFPITKFFQTQHAVFEVLFSSAVSLMIHVPLCWLFIDKVNLGLKGLAIAQNFSVAVHVIVLLAFVRYSPRFKMTYSSITWDAFHDLGDFSRLAVSSATMVCLEEWSYQVLTLLAGLLPNSEVNISSFSICMGLLSTSNIPALALGVAASVRVSNELGAGKPHAARSVVAVSLGIGFLYGAVMACLIYSLRYIWGWAFSNDFEVVMHVARTAPFLAVLAILYACGAILSGVVRGIGWQRAGAIANLGAYYVVGLPVTLISIFVIQLDARGLFLGLGCGLVTQILILISIILCPNWDQLAQEALLRSLSFNSGLPTSAPPVIKPLPEEWQSGKTFNDSHLKIRSARSNCGNIYVPYLMVRFDKPHLK